MWEKLLLWLPRRYSPREIEFHRQRVIVAFRYIDDKPSFKRASTRLSYSLDILRKTDPATWKKIAAQGHLVSRH
jgi:hypothetical protein